VKAGWLSAIILFPLYFVTDTLTAREAIAEAASRLGKSAELRADASRDASLLLLHVLGISRAQLHAHPDRVLTPEEAASFGTVIARRLAHEPIQYITGEQEFYGLALHVTPAVLIPRPETEHLVESVLAELDSRRTLKIADIGTGSGAIAIALADSLPHARITATDISRDALDVARENARRHSVLDRIWFLECDLLEPVLKSDESYDQTARFDAVVSNPPYIAAEDAPRLHPQVRDFEPDTALFASGNGLDIYRRLIPQAHAALVAGGLLALEIGEGQRSAVAEFLAGWTAVRFVLDLQQIPRVALARKP
jgi:release factor glutamine methyltransferase